MHSNHVRPMLMEWFVCWRLTTFSTFVVELAQHFRCALGSTNQSWLQQTHNVTVVLSYVPLGRSTGAGDSVEGVWQQLRITQPRSHR